MVNSISELIDQYNIPLQFYKNDKKIRQKKFDVASEHKIFDQKYTMYLEESDHVLFGWNTPMFIARVNPHDQNNTPPDIVYDRIQYVKTIFE